MSLPPFIYIDTPEAWKACIDDLACQSRVAIDLEANSLFAYRERVCLIQISTLERDYIIDPLAKLELEPFGALIASDSIEKVLHASEYDLILLKREFDWDLSNLFDTMWAARILGYQNMGLAWFLHELYGVVLSKRYQKTNWARRPLSEDQLLYAQKDTAYLLQLRDELAAQLEARGLLAEALEIFKNRAKIRLPDREFDPEGFWSVRGAPDLTPRQRAVLKALYLWRDMEAKRRDTPPFKVMNNSVLLALAEAAPNDLPSLRQVGGLSPRVVARCGDRLLSVIQHAKNGPVPVRRSRKKRPDEQVVERYDKLFQWRKRQAQQRGVQSDVILSRETMWEIARTNPSTLAELGAIESLGPHRLELHGMEILGELK